ncbi:hypothetical protein HHK36_013918 [Tetracentron sinense]|uniref:CBS domain-containing protein n=1 Tax=Tetracentron sinense TaxID=13715 RepID=A0A834Z466_TETSI|nr:hypothetical protein HHK36_013918 [Tetracentron sinense]
MQTAMEGSSKASGKCQWLMDKKVRDLIAEKRRLVEVPYTASLGYTMNAMVANRVVAAPPGHWIGAGGSMIVESESDKQSGAVSPKALHRHDCMEVFSKGIHRALVPVDSHMENISVVELVESASSYHMLTQMDVLSFMKAHASEQKGVMLRTVRELGGITENVFAVTDRAKVIEAIECMRTASLNAVPIIEALDALNEDHKQLVYVRLLELLILISCLYIIICTFSDRFLPVMDVEAQYR